MKKRQESEGAGGGEIPVRMVCREGLARQGVGLVYDERMLLHLCPWDPHHIECPDRLSSIWRRCSELGLVERCQRVDSRLATDSELELYHSKSFLSKFRKLGQTSGGQYSPEEVEAQCREFDSVYLCEDTEQAARLAAGSSVELVSRVLDHEVQCGLGLVRPPGHHAMADTPCGFCGFNNIVIAAKSALQRGLKRILIVDFDLHHGQGTQYAFYSDPRVLYMSVHRYERGRYWPHLRDSNFDQVGDGAGVGYNVNVALNTVGCGPSDYLAVFHSVFLPVATEFQPELVLVSAGYDAAVGCPEGEMMLSPATYSHLLGCLAHLGQGRLVVLLEGGYCLPSLAESVALSLRCLLGEPCPPLLPGEAKPSVIESIRGTVTALRPHWNCFKVWESSSRGEEIFQPDLTFSPPEDWPPVPFPTRDYYLVYDEETAHYWKTEVARLVLTTDLSCPDTKLVLFYDEDMMKHKEEGEAEVHPECPERISRIWSSLESAGFPERREVKVAEQGRQLREEESCLVHDSEHWLNMQSLSSLSQEERDQLADTFNSIYINQWSLQSALLSAGGVLTCLDSVAGGDARAGLAVVRPPGHHAEPDQPHGFCFFNNIAIAAKYALSSLGMSRVLILDWDVHHGNGIQHMFYNDNRVLYISLHRYDNGSFFPCSEDAGDDKVGDGAGEGFNINIPFNRGRMGDSEYCLAFQQIVLPVGYEFNPDLVLVSAGFDAAVGDPLGGYKVTPAMYGHMTSQLCLLAGGRVVVALEGGYNLSTISECATMCCRALLGDPLPLIQPGKAKDSAIQTIRGVIRHHSRFWRCLDLMDCILPDTLTTSTTTTTSATEDTLRRLDEQMSEMGLEAGPARSVQRSQLVLH